MTKPTDLSFTIEDLDKAMSKVKSSAGESKTPPCPPSQNSFYKYVSGVERHRLEEIDKVLHGYENPFSLNTYTASDLIDRTDSDD